MKRALITGASGFIGRHVAAALEGAGYLVTGVDVAESRFQDARDWFRLRASSIAYDAVVHCAAVTGGRRVMDWTPIDHAENLAIDAAVFQWAVQARPGRLVYFSSSCAYPVGLGDCTWPLRENHIDLRNPKWPDQLYGWCKLTGELLAETARDTGLAVSVVRPFSVYGPGMNDGFAVRGFSEQVARRADPVEVWGDADQVRDYIHVSDVAGAVAAIVRRGVDGAVNLGTGRGTSLRELVAMMGRAAGYSPEVKVNASMPAGVPSLVADPSRLHGFYQPKVSLEDYLAETLGGGGAA